MMQTPATLALEASVDIMEYRLRLTEQMVWALRLLRNALTYFAVERGEKTVASLREGLP